jgi:hypothetical protein
MNIIWDIILFFYALLDVHKFSETGSVSQIEMEKG